MTLWVPAFSNAFPQNFALLFVKLLIPAFVQCLPDLFHQCIVKIEVMLNRKAHGKHLICFKKVPQICSGMVEAGRAAAVFVNRRKIPLIFGIHNIADALPGKQVSMPRIA